MTALIERLKEDARLTIAALIGYEFKIDPLLVLKSDFFDFAIRSAALEVVQEAREKAEAARTKQ